MVSGIKIRFVDIIVVCFSSNVGLRLIRNFWLLNFVCKWLWVCLVMGVKPSMMGLITCGISSIIVVVFIVSCNIFLIL